MISQNESGVLGIFNSQNAATSCRTDGSTIEEQSQLTVVVPAARNGHSSTVEQPLGERASIEAVDKVRGASSPPLLHCAARVDS